MKRSTFFEVLFTCNEVRFLVNIYFFTSLLLLYFNWQSKNVFLKAELAVSGLAWLISECSITALNFLLAIFICQMKWFANLYSISVILLLKFIFLIPFFYLSKIFRQYFYFYLSKIFRQYFYFYLSKIFRQYFHFYLSKN